MTLLTTAWEYTGKVKLVVEVSYRRESHWYGLSPSGERRLGGWLILYQHICQTENITHSV